MNKIYIQPVVEDILHEKVLQKLFQNLRKDIELYPALGKKGNDYIYQKLAQFNGAAIPDCRYFLLLDTDKPICVVDFLKSIITFSANPYFYLRLCVVEIETWLLADRENFAKFLGIRESEIPFNLETEISKPKEFVIALARKSKKKGIKSIVPEGTAKQGKGYNLKMVEFIENDWDFRNASLLSRSLQKTIQKIQNL